MLEVINPEFRTPTKEDQFSEFADAKREKRRVYLSEWRKKNPDYDRRYKEANKDKIRVQSRTRTLKKYGLTDEEFDSMVETQSGLCAICFEPPVKGQNSKHGLLVVDHSHDSGRVRGLLCDNCNHGLGKFKDDIKRIGNAMEYLAS